MYVTSLQLRRPPTYTRSSSVSSFGSTLSNLKRGQQYLGALVAVVRSNRYTSLSLLSLKIWPGLPPIMGRGGLLLPWCDILHLLSVLYSEMLLVLPVLKWLKQAWILSTVFDWCAITEIKIQQWWLGGRASASWEVSLCTGGSNTALGDYTRYEHVLCL